MSQHQCPACEYSTPKSIRLEQHKRNTGHGRIASKRREFKGHLSAQRKGKKG